MGYFSNNGYKKDSFDSSIFQLTENNIVNGKKIKETYSLSGLCHAWASSNVPRGRSGSSMFFELDTIYSYGHHFKAAKIFIDKTENKLVLINSKKYSVSTGNHLSEIRSAVSHLKSVTVPDVSPKNKEQHVKNLDYLNTILFSIFDDIYKMKGWSNFDMLLKAVDSINTYSNYFKLNKNVTLDQNTLDLVRDCIEIRSIKNKTREVKRKQSNINKEIQLKADNMGTLLVMESEFPAFLAQWRDNKLDRRALENKMGLRVKTKGPFGHEKTNYLKIKNAEYCFLRVVENKVETSKGADVPLEHAVRLLKIILKNEAKKGDRIGHYSLETIKDDPKGDKTIIIGCHDILLSEAVNVLKPYIGR